MGTLITEDMFNRLWKIREELVGEFKPDKVSGIHLPWAGARLFNRVEREMNLYVVGIATHKDYQDDADFGTALAYLEKDIRENPTGEKDTPWWRFVSGLTNCMFEKPHYACWERFGWSNTIKIAYNDDLQKWPTKFVEAQKDLCVEALRYEFCLLRNTAIFIGSNDEKWDIVPHVLPEAKWDKIHQADSIYSWNAEGTDNLYIWGNHPKSDLGKRKMLPIAEMLISSWAKRRQH